jgi:ribosomal protein S18 acetylase RimI-like enzyme
MSIRKAIKSDEALIKAIHKEAKKELGSHNLFQIWDKYLTRESPYNYYVIEGKAFMRYGYSSRLKCYTIKEIGVLNQHKGQGIAQKLIEFTKRPLYLTCNTDNEAGNKFYKRIGMKHKGVKDSKNGLFQMNIWVI